ncbi:hypothetical protein PENTCL1PPCAC_12133 [Pristionchus entomophagus]|uniref:Uncharacterized protein n=1 Tax=Pristionchus entomophagus TaxID=358040 RepID=A0AAV5T3T8_9BILA|nr:hypothetical protein PENTCL1PPCAC_12133 [Pristionchus entomophagus]
MCRRHLKGKIENYDNDPRRAQQSAVHPIRRKPQTKANQIDPASRRILRDWRPSEFPRIKQPTEKELRPEWIQRSGMSLMQDPRSLRIRVPNYELEG